MKDTKGLKRIFKYLGITFLISWGLMGLMILLNQFGILCYNSFGGTLLVAVVAFSPAVASYMFYEDDRETKKIKSFLQYIFMNLKKRTTWIVIAVFFVIHLLTGILFGESTGIPVYMCIPYLPVMIFGGGLEEVGWRGFLQPNMERKIPSFLATLLVGIIWAFWHTPMWFIEGSGQQMLNYGLFFLYCIWLSFMLNVLSKITKSVFACILFHAWGNVVAALYSNMVFGSYKIAVVYVIEIICCCIVLLRIDKGEKRKE